MQAVPPNAQAFQNNLTAGGSTPGQTIAPTDGQDNVQASTVMASIQDLTNTVAYLAALVLGPGNAPPNNQPPMIASTGSGSGPRRKLLFADVLTMQAAPANAGDVCYVTDAGMDYVYTVGTAPTELGILIIPSTVMGHTADWWQSPLYTQIMNTAGGDTGIPPTLAGIIPVQYLPPVLEHLVASSGGSDPGTTSGTPVSAPVTGGNQRAVLNSTTDRPILVTCVAGDLIVASSGVGDTLSGVFQIQVGGASSVVLGPVDMQTLAAGVASSNLVLPASILQFYFKPAPGNNGYSFQLQYYSTNSSRVKISDVQLYARQL